MKVEIIDNKVVFNKRKIKKLAEKFKYMTKADRIYKEQCKSYVSGLSLTISSLKSEIQFCEKQKKHSQSQLTLAIEQKKEAVKTLKSIK